MIEIRQRCRTPSSLITKKAHFTGRFSMRKTLKIGSFALSGISFGLLMLSGISFIAGEAKASTGILYCGSYTSGLGGAYCSSSCWTLRTCYAPASGNVGDWCPCLLVF